MYFSRPEPESIHAGVHLDENFDRTRQRRCLEHLDLLHMVHYNGKPARSDLGQLVVGEKTFQQENAACIVTLAQRNGGIELEQRQPVSFRERRKNAPFVSLEEIELTAPNEDREPDIDRQRALQQLSGFIRQLKPLDRQIIISYLEGLDAAHIADITGLTPANIGMKIHRIKKILAHRIRKEQSHA